MTQGLELPTLMERADDVDDVRWALSTAQAQWSRGVQEDAVVWIRRAADAADEAGNPGRAAELRHGAAALANEMFATSARAQMDTDVQGIEVEVDIDLGTVEEIDEFEEIEEIEDFEEIEEIEPEHDLNAESEQLVAQEFAPRVESALPESNEPAERFGDQDFDLSHTPQQRVEQAVEKQKPDAVRMRQMFTSAPTLEVEELDLASAIAELQGTDSSVSQAPTLVPKENSSSQLDWTDDVSAGSVEIPATNAEDVIAGLGIEPEERAIARPPTLPDAEELVPDSALELADSVGASSVEDTPEQELVLDEDFAPGALSVEQAAAEAEASDSSAWWNSSSAVSDGEQDSPQSVVAGISLSDVAGFEDLPVNVQRRLARTTKVATLAQGEEVGFFGAALVTEGIVSILPAISEDSGAIANQGEVVFTRGTLADSMALRVVAKVDGTQLAVWSDNELESAIADCPWVHDELRFIADRFLALCGATLGPLGDGLDESLRATIFQRLEVRTLEAGQQLTTRSEAIQGLYILAGGHIDVLGADSDSVEAELSAGAILFAAAMMSGQKAPRSARVGDGGALVLYAPRAVAHELMISVPPLLEVLASS